MVTNHSPAPSGCVGDLHSLSDYYPHGSCRNPATNPRVRRRGREVACGQANGHQPASGQHGCGDEKTDARDVVSAEPAVHPGPGTQGRLDGPRPHWRRLPPGPLGCVHLREHPGHPPGPRPRCRDGRTQGRSSQPPHRRPALGRHRARRLGGTPVPTQGCSVAHSRGPPVPAHDDARARQAPRASRHQCRADVLRHGQVV